jgi:hypothetical protein
VGLDILGADNQFRVKKYDTTYLTDEGQTVPNVYKHIFNFLLNILYASKMAKSACTPPGRFPFTTGGGGPPLANPALYQHPLSPLGCRYRACLLMARTGRAISRRSAAHPLTQNYNTNGRTAASRHFRFGRLPRHHPNLLNLPASFVGRVGRVARALPVFIKVSYVRSQQINIACLSFGLLCVRRVRRAVGLASAVLCRPSRPSRRDACKIVRRSPSHYSFFCV